MFPIKISQLVGIQPISGQTKMIINFIKHETHLTGGD